MFTLFLLTAYAAAGGFFEPVLTLFALALENPQAIGALLGLLVPLLVSVIKQPGLSPARRRALAYAASGLVGLLTVISMGQFNLADLTSTLLVTIAVSQATYAELWRPTGVAAAVEKRTNLTPDLTPKLGFPTLAVAGEPGDTSEQVIDRWYTEAVDESGYRPVGEVTVQKSANADTNGGILIAVGKIADDV